MHINGSDHRRGPLDRRLARAARVGIAGGSLALLTSAALISCDDASSTGASRSAQSTTATAPAEPAASAIELAASQPVDPNLVRPLIDLAPVGPTQRIRLVAIPFTAEVPTTWSVQSGFGGKLVLAATNGPADMPSLVEIMLAPRPNMTPDQYDLLVRDIRRAASQPADANGRQVKTVVSERDGMRIIEETERIRGAATTNPDATPVRWTVQFIVPSGGLDFAVYEMNVTGLSEAMFEKDQKFFREIFDSVKVDPAALNAATRPIIP